MDKQNFSHFFPPTARLKNVRKKGKSLRKVNIPDREFFPEKGWKFQFYNYAIILFQRVKMNKISPLKKCHPDLFAILFPF